MKSKLAVPAHADMVGDTIHAFYIFPTAGTVHNDLGTFTAPGGGSIFKVSYSVTGTQISVTAPDDRTGIMWSNGLEFVDESRDPGIIGITLDSATTAPVSIADATLTPNSVSFNFQGQTWGPGQTAVFDLQFAASPAHRRCWPSRPDLGERWPSRLVATAAEDRLSFRATRRSRAAAIADELELAVRDAMDRQTGRKSQR